MNHRFVHDATLSRRHPQRHELPWCELSLDRKNVTVVLITKEREREREREMYIIIR